MRDEKLVPKDLEIYKRGVFSATFLRFF